MRSLRLLPAALLCAALAASAEEPPAPPVEVLKFDSNSGDLSKPLTPIEPTEKKIIVDEAQKGPATKVEIVFDSSGSMAQVLSEAKTKMHFSKKLLSKFLLEQWKERAKVGLRLYGSRREHDCKDNFLAVGFSEKSMDEIETKLAVMEPVGMTPIAKSLMDAFDDLKGWKGPKRIVLFTDGEETCKGDPCQLLKKIKENKTVDFRMYVVGIGMKKGDKAFDDLKCLNELKGKDDVIANDEEELMESLSDDVSKDLFGSGKNLYVKSPKVNAGVALYKWENGRRKYFKSFTSAWGTKVPPGEYDAEVGLEPAYRFEHFIVPPKKRITLVVTGSGKVRVNFTHGLLDVDILNKNAKVLNRLRSDKTYLVKTGRYKIQITGTPLYSKFIPKFYVYPGGEHIIDIEDAGGIQFDFPDITGLYVYKQNDEMLGNLLTNTPFVLKTGSYRMYVNEYCYLRQVEVGTAKPTVQHITCPPRDSL